MRCVHLYVRSRLTGHALGLLGIVALATWLWRALTHGDALSSAVVLNLPPAAAAAIIAACTHSPFGDAEQTASRSLPALRVGHLAGLVLAAALVLAPAAGSQHVAYGAWAVVRNLAGYTGLALLAARYLGSAGSWGAPLAYGGLVLISGNGALWAWPGQAASSGVAATVALGMLAVGLLVIGPKGARQDAGEIA